MIVNSEFVLVSILVPIYNVSKYIEQCAVSLFEQTYDNIEYVFVDDCSLDDSIALLKKVMERYPKRKDQVKIVAHEKNAGLSNARITGINNCSGLYLLNVDSDDYIERDMVEVMMKKALDSDSDMVVCDFNYVFIDKVKRMNNMVENDRLEYIASLITRHSSVCVWGRLIKKSLYVANSVYPIPDLNYAEDYVVTPRLVFYAHNIVKVDRALYNYVQSNSISYTHNLSSISIGNAILANDVLCDFFIKHGLHDKLPLQESKAINLVTLLYATPLNLLSEGESACEGLDLRDLRISLLHKCLLVLAQRKCTRLLYGILSIINFMRNIL